MFTRFEVQKNTLFSTYSTLLLLLYAPPFWNAPIFIKLIILRSEVCSDWPAIQCIVIGRIPQACDGNVTPLPYWDAMSQPFYSLWSRHDETKTIKPAINDAFVAFSEEIITDYNDSYGLFTCCATPRKHNTMSAFVIVEMPNMHYSTQLKTHVWIVSSKFFKYRNAGYLQAVSQKHQTVLATLELPHFIVFTAIHTVHIVGYSLPGSVNSPP